MAIQQDAMNEEGKNQEQEQQQGQQQEQLDERELIALRREQEQEAQQAEAEQTAEQVADEQIAAAGLDGLIADPTKARVKVKLEGQEQELPLSDVLASYQKNEVASRRLQEATAAKNEALAMRQEAEALLAQAKEKPGSVSEEVTGTAKKVIDALIEGDEEVAAQALAELAGRGNSTTQSVDADQVAAEVKRKLDVESALTKFSADFSDIAADPYLADMTNQHLKASIEEKQALGEAVDFGAELQAAGNKTRDWLKSKGVAVSGEQSSTTSETNNRQTRKQGLEDTPSLSVSAASQVEQVEDARSVIAEMRKERGIG